MKSSFQQVRRGRIVAGAVLATMLVLTGCSSSGAQGSASDPSGPYRSLDEIVESGVFRVGVLESVPPYSSLNTATGDFEGFEIDYAAYLAQEIGGESAEVDYVPVTKATRVPLVEHGELDMLVATLTISEERAEVVDFSEPYFSAPVAFAVREGAEISSLTDLEGMTNCTPQGSAAWQFIEAIFNADPALAPVFESLDNVDLPTPSDCLFALERDRDVDFIGNDYPTLAEQTRGSSGVVLLDETAGAELNQFGVAVAKDNDELLSAVDTAICSSFDDGTWTDLWDTWVGLESPEGWPRQC